VEVDATVGGLEKHPSGDEGMEVDVEIEGGTKALNEGDRAAPGFFDPLLACTPPLPSEQPP